MKTIRRFDLYSLVYETIKLVFPELPLKTALTSDWTATWLSILFGRLMCHLNHYPASSSGGVGLWLRML